MARLLKGKEVADALTETIRQDVTVLKERGITPTLCIIRAGERAEDLAYERGVLKRAETTGVFVRHVVLDGDVTQEAYDRVLREANEDSGIHGILICLPLPQHLDSERARRMLAPEKDVDGCTDLSQAGVFTDKPTGFPPCTAEAVMEILRFYGIVTEGKKAAVIGRSLVIGRPVSMLLLHANATVVTCHTRTENLAEIAGSADILVSAAGRLRMVTRAFTNPGQVVIDVGINRDEEKNGISGDVFFEDVEPYVSAITPVPGGVGSVTSSVLVSHVIQAARRQNNI